VAPAERCLKAMSTAQIVTLVGLGVLFLLAVSELASARWRDEPVGAVIREWSRDHPFLAGLLAAFVGAFAAHIFWPWPP
jgi:hypothetical protein